MLESWRQDVRLAVLVSSTSLLVAMLGAAFGFDYLVLAYADVTASHESLLDRLTARDGKVYQRIAEEGYFDSPGQKPIAFFPLYPLLSRTASMLLGVRVPIAMLLVSNVCFALACLALIRYAGWQSHDPVRLLLIVAFLPAGLFFRVGYSESLFLLLAIVTLYGIKQAWPLEAVAVIAGAATATRAPGIALSAAVILAAWRRYPIGRLMPTIALSMWGLLAFMIYQYAAFGDALAFVDAQRYFALRPVQNKFAAYALCEPIWSVYVPSSPAYWRRFGAQSPAFSPAFQNPFHFLGAIGLAAIGTRRKWLSEHELVYCWLGLLIPYFTRGYEMCMGSQARFVTVLFPLYFVLERFASKLDALTWTLLVAVAAFFLGVYLGMFGAGYMFI